MSTNQNLGDLTPKSSQPGQAVQVDPTEEFDVNRKARQEALNRVKDVLDRAAQGSKLNQKDFKKALNNLYNYNRMSDELATGLVRDLFRIVRAVAQSEVNLFALRTNMKTVVLALEKQGVVTEEMMREIHDKEVLPAELKQMGGNEKAEQLLRQEDVAAAAEITDDTSDSHDQTQTTNQEQ